jgi:catechol 2,3-dioxygenase-like lactoylglutathione lyase family enzyme
METQFNAVMFAVSDMDRSVEFYRDRLGLKPVTLGGWSEFELSEDFHLGLHRIEEGAPMPQNIASAVGLVIYTDNLDAEVKRLKERGIQFAFERMEAPNIWIAEFRDPDGYSHQIFEIKR